MKEHFKDFLSKDEWLVEERGWRQQDQSAKEAQFALGNGILGSRGVLEELPYDSTPGTYITGLYDKVGAQVVELVNLPNPLTLKITTNGEKLGMVAMDVVKHTRFLDMRKGLLVRQTVFQNSRKKKLDYQSMRFLSMKDKDLGVMRVYLTALDDDADIIIQSTIDTTVCNKGALTEGRKRHFRITEVDQFENGEYLKIKTLEKDISIAYATSSAVRYGKKKDFIKDDVFRLRLKRNQPVCITKLFSIITEDYGNPRELKRVALKRIRKNMKLGFYRLISEHTRSWNRLWLSSNINIAGAPSIEKALRFNIYHMLICGADTEGRASIGAKTLSGEGYHGHIFWDAEIFNLPFYAYTNPPVARSMLLYRYNRLDEAKAIAKERGYKGAMFPWESADTGKETTPTWAKDLDGTIIRIHTNKMEHHISADIAYAVYKYFEISGDEKFMRDYGFELLFECASFWVSRVEYNKKRHKFEIRHVIGPDEFHIDVNNNAYTNIMAKWNLLFAYRMYKKMKRDYPDAFVRLTKKLGLKGMQVNEWKYIASRLGFCIRDDKVIEQFDGYFKKKRAMIAGFDDNFMPLVPQSTPVKEFGKTQLVKQADVVMFLYLLSDAFGIRTKRRNYEYYVKRTLHKSSLSPAVYALMAAEVSDLIRAFRFFRVALLTDLMNIHGNAASGIHAANLGGVWQVAVNGFGGVRIAKGLLSINPKLPQDWRSFDFSIRYQGADLKVGLTKERVRLRLKPKRKGGGVTVKVYGTLRQLRGGKGYIFKKRR